MHAVLPARQYTCVSLSMSMLLTCSRSTSGLPSPVNDVLIVKDGKALPAGEVGEIWLRGPNIMKEYWGDPGIGIQYFPLMSQCKSSQQRLPQRH